MYATPYSWVNSILIAGYTVFPLTVMLNNSVHSRRTVLVQFKLYCTVLNRKSLVFSIDYNPQCISSLKDAANKQSVKWGSSLHNILPSACL